LKRSNDELSTFAHVASHDLQEPLRVIANYTQLIRREYGRTLDDRGNKLTEVIVEAAKRMSGLIADLLDYARATSDEPEVRTVDLAEVCATAMQNLRSQIEETNATITCKSLPKVIGTEVQLLLVLQNLLSNSLKYAKPGVPPRVTIDNSWENGSWRISLSDNGQGFQPEYAERIFGIFYRLHGKETPGTGIGLAICKTIIERHGGAIGAIGHPGEGATFWFTLPPA
jgi:light-regulated signal transduction histidine kinase (bacteriophytochrome)